MGLGIVWFSLASALLPAAAITPWTAAAGLTLPAVLAARFLVGFGEGAQGCLCVVTCAWRYRGGGCAPQQQHHPHPCPHPPHPCPTPQRPCPALPGVALPAMNNLVARNIPPARKATALGACFTGFHTGGAGAGCCWGWEALQALPGRLCCRSTRAPALFQ